MSTLIMNDNDTGFLSNREMLIALALMSSPVLLALALIVAIIAE